LQQVVGVLGVRRQFAGEAEQFRLDIQQALRKAYCIHTFSFWLDDEFTFRFTLQY
jgi:hypothetical protein